MIINKSERICIIVFLFICTAALIHFSAPDAFSQPDENNTLSVELTGKEIKDDEHSSGLLNGALKTTFNTKDILIGIEYSVYNSKKYLLWFNTSFYFRPYKKTIFVETEEDHYFQFRENRYAFELNIEKIFPVTELLGVQISGGAAYTFGSFAGTSIHNPENNFTPVATCGLTLNIHKTAFLTAGYQYIRIPETPPNRVFIKISFLW